MKVLVTDDNAIVRMGLSKLLREIAEVDEILEASNGEEAIEIARNLSPDIVLLDVRMPRMGGLEALPVLVDYAKVIMLTSSDDPDTISSAMELGATGYLVHGTIGADQVSGAIATCVQGGLVLGPEAVSHVSLRMTGKAPERNPLEGVLTERELQVLEAAALGESNKEIAAKQFLSPRTVKNYLNSAYVKLGVHTRSEAIIAWREANASDV